MANLLRAGDFDGQIDPEYWSGGTISRSLGYPRLGCAEIADGERLTQRVELVEGQGYTLHYFYRLAPGSRLTVAVGESLSQIHQGAPESTWCEAVLMFAVHAGGTAEVSFTAAGAACWVDSVTLMPGGLPARRAGLALTVAGRLAGLAADVGLSTTPSAAGPEGDYTAAVDEALRSAGATNRWGDPDVTRLGPDQVNAALEAIQTAMLRTLRSTYALRVDVSLGPRRESYSQIAQSIDAMLAGAGGNKRAAIGRLRREGGWER